MIYKPDDTLNVAIVNKGQLLSDIYKYVPEYLEWLMINHHSFCLDVNLFLKLPKPTPYYKDNRYDIKIDNVMTKHYNHTMALIFYAGLKSSEFYKTINEKVKIKTEKHFNIIGLSPNFSVEYALNVIKVVGFEPKIIPFVFSDASIEKNNLKVEKYVSQDFDANTHFESSYEEYSGAYGYDDFTINEAFDGDPENYWNID